jgi:predicted SprT family Zn-dependent metalloprotease
MTKVDTDVSSSLTSTRRKETELPTYQYKCKCGQELEREFPLSDIKQRVRCECGRMARKVITVPNVKCVYSYMDRVNGNPRVDRGKGR